MRISVTKLPFIREFSLIAFLDSNTFVRPDWDGLVYYLEQINPENVCSIQLNNRKTNLNWSMQQRNQRNYLIIYDTQFNSLTYDRSHDNFSLIKTLNSALCECEDIHNVLCAWSPFASPIRIFVNWNSGSPFEWKINAFFMTNAAISIAEPQSFYSTSTVRWDDWKWKSFQNIGTVFYFYFYLDEESINYERKEKPRFVRGRKTPSNYLVGCSNDCFTLIFNWLRLLLDGLFIFFRI